MSQEIEIIQKKILPILKQAGILRSSIFGSVARGEATADSDVDILVEIPRPYGLFKFLEIKNNLEDALNKSVDLVEYESIKPRIKERVLAEQVRIL